MKPDIPLLTFKVRMAEAPSDVFGPDRGWDDSVPPRRMTEQWRVFRL